MRDSRIGRRRALAGLLLLASLPACRTARPRGLFVDVTRMDASASKAFVDDVLVWPVLCPDGPWAGTIRDRLLRRLREGLLRRDYSVLSRTKSLELAERFGPGPSAALRAGRELGADGVLIFELGRWDERGLANAGVLRAEGSFRLMSPEGKRIWYGRFRMDTKVVDSWSEIRGLEDRRKVAVDRLAEGLTARMPAHELR